MIGLADRNQTFALFESLVNGKTDQVITNMAEQYKNGANPTTMLQDLINITHMTAKVKIVPACMNDDNLSESERNFAKGFLRMYPLPFYQNLADDDKRH